MCRGDIDLKDVTPLFHTVELLRDSYLPVADLFDISPREVALSVVLRHSEPPLVVDSENLHHLSNSQLQFTFVLWREIKERPGKAFRATGSCRRHRAGP